MVSEKPHRALLAGQPAHTGNDTILETEPFGPVGMIASNTHRAINFKNAVAIRDGVFSDVHPDGIFIVLFLKVRD